MPQLNICHWSSWVLLEDVEEGSFAQAIAFASGGWLEPTCTSHQDTSHKDGDDLSSLDTSCREQPKNMEKSQRSGSREGEDQESKEVAEERSGVQVLEDQRVVQEKEVVV